MKGTSKKLLAVILSVMLVISLLPVVAFGEEENSYNVELSGLTPIGEYARGSIYLVKGIPSNVTGVVFSEYDPEDVVCLSSIVGAGMIEEGNEAPISDVYKFSKSVWEGRDDIDLAEEYEDYSFDNCYGYALMDGEDNPWIIIETDFQETEPSQTIPFSAVANGTDLLNTKVEENGYSYFDWKNNQNAFADLYTIIIPYGTERVELDFGDNLFDVYLYDSEGGYRGQAGKNQTTAVFTQYDAFGVVQSPYNDDYTSGGEVQFAVCFQ